MSATHCSIFPTYLEIIPSDRTIIIIRVLDWCCCRYY